MTEHFFKFKRTEQTVRLTKSLIAGGAFGAFFSGIFLTLSKLAVVKFAPIFSLPIGLATFVLSGVLFYFVLRKTDKQIAEELDKRFALQEKTQTMIEYRHENGDMFLLQRQDAEKALADIPVKAFKPKYWWVYPTALCIGVGALLSGFIVKDRRTPQEEVTPFEITAMQIAGIEELIKYVDNSEMEEIFKQNISSELSALLSDLKSATTENQMRAELAESMAYIQDTTYNSSSSTEILNALWNTQDPLTQSFAKTLDTSGWNTPDWGDFAEKMNDYRAAFDHQQEEGEETPTDSELIKELQWNLQNTSIKINMALTQSGIEETDKLYSVIHRFVNANETGSAEKRFFGFSVIGQALDYIVSYDIATTQLDNTFTNITTSMYDVIAGQKTNTNVGEYTMTKLSTLFLVPLPGFERPDFSKSGNNGSSDSGEGDKENKPSDGGIGEGATYGSNDLVLDPLTGKYVEYGTLLDKYYAVMYEKLENGNYTEKQKEIIENYFKLLYGIEQKEGN